MTDTDFLSSAVVLAGQLEELRDAVCRMLAEAQLSIATAPGSDARSGRGTLRRLKRCSA
jgi:hypothetical protein